jgi:hypothetical protein
MPQVAHSSKSIESNVAKGSLTAPASGFMLGKTPQPVLAHCNFRRQTSTTNQVPSRPAQFLAKMESGLVEDTTNVDSILEMTFVNCLVETVCAGAFGYGFLEPTSIPVFGAKIGPNHRSHTNNSSTAKMRSAQQKTRLGKAPEPGS